jgi:hypothetical protein
VKKIKMNRIGVQWLAFVNRVMNFRDAKMIFFLKEEGTFKCEILVFHPLNETRQIGIAVRTITQCVRR